jgi:hypothetical protein
MDRRTQRLVFLILFFGVAVVLYRSLGSRQYAVPRGGHSSTGLDESDLRGLEPANSTLGVGDRKLVQLETVPCKIEC